ncbi:MAG: chemotaxis protein CheB [bacterium]
MPPRETVRGSTKKKPKVTKTIEAKKTQEISCIVGIGASAGGLEALQDFFSHMAPDSGLAFVVVQHLSPDYKSLMVELLSKNTKMQVVRIEDGMRLEKNKVFLIPPKQNVTLIGKKFKLTVQDHSAGLNLPIDLFLRSLAENWGERSVGIILSGTGSDGTRGIRAIKEAGGMVMVQAPENAKFDGMPTSAIATGLADYVLSTDSLPNELLKFVKHPFLSNPIQLPSSLASQEDILISIIALLRKQTSVDFTYYKPNTVVRRIERRMGIAQVESMSDYLHYLQQSSKEVTSLYKDLLIGVTKFFRDTEAFFCLEKQVIPDLFKMKASNGIIRIWVAGCASGEEAYSIAMLFREYMDRVEKPYDVKIFATDIDRDAIEVAGSGVYPVTIAGEVSEERLKRFFVEKKGSFQIIREIREMVVFAPQNLLKDPPFTKIDLVSCRNMLIYLQPVLQKRILSLFSFALNEGGYLFLGASETLGDLVKLYTTIDSKWKVYGRIQGSLTAVDSTIAFQPARERLLRTHFSSQNQLSETQTSRVENTFITDIESRLINEYAPTCLIVDEHSGLQHSFGQLPDFIRMPVGQASLNLVKMLPKELALAFSTAMHRVLKDRKPITYHNIRIQKKANNLGYNLTVEPLPTTLGSQLLLLVFIEELKIVAPSTKTEKNYDPQKDQSQRIKDLELELQMTRENLQATVEELETSNEELQATNEELLAANEEIQSTNEELQSVNEELYTVNTEYQNKINELTQANNDIDNLLNSSDVGTIFLDKDLRIRKFTTVIAKEINLLAHDVGRPVSDLAHPLLKVIAEDIPKALDGNHGERTVMTDNGKWVMMRTMPYKTIQDISDGVIINLVNVTPIKASEETLRKAHDELEARVKERTAELTDTNQKLTKEIDERRKVEKDLIEAQNLLQLTLTANRMATWTWDYKSSEVHYNKLKAEMLGYSVEEFPTNVYKIMEMVHPDDYEPAMETMRIHLKGLSHSYSVDYRIRSKAGEWMWFHDLGWVTERDKDGKPLTISGAVIDISERKNMEEQISLLQSEYNAIVENSPFLSCIISQDGKVVTANQQFSTFFAVPANKVPGQNITELVPKDLAKNYRKEFAQITEKSMTIETIETLGKANKNEMNTFQVRKFPISRAQTTNSKSPFLIGFIAIQK